MVEDRPDNLLQKLARLPGVLAVVRHSWSVLRCDLNRVDEDGQPLPFYVWRGVFRRRPYSKDLEAASAFLVDLGGREGELRSWGETQAHASQLEDEIPIDWARTTIVGIGVGGRFPPGVVHVLLSENVESDDLVWRHWSLTWRAGVFDDLLDQSY